MYIILIGAPGSGKGTQADHLQAELGLTHVASGDLFRENINNQTRLGQLAAGYINRGQLVPDDVTIAMVRERLERPDVQKGVIFDGFPRTLGQAQALDTMLGEMGRKIAGVLFIDVADDEIVRRLSGRLLCRECQTPFHTEFNPFKTCPYNKCHGEHLYQREDDKPETVRARLKTYREQTAPLIQYYQKAGLLVPIAGEGTIEEVRQLTLEAARALKTTGA